MYRCLRQIWKRLLKVIFSIFTKVIFSIFTPFIIPIVCIIGIIDTAGVPVQLKSVVVVHKRIVEGSSQVAIPPYGSTEREHDVYRLTIDFDGRLMQIGVTEADYRNIEEGQVVSVKYSRGRLKKDINILSYKLFVS